MTSSFCENPDSEENEEHLLKCPFLVNDESIKNEIFQVMYSDVFSNSSKQVKVVNVFRKIMGLYDKLKTR